MFKIHYQDITRDTTNTTLGEAIDRYMEMKDGVFSHAIIAVYKS